MSQVVRRRTVGTRSGFVGWFTKKSGIEVSTWTVTQALVGERIPVSEAKAGDMLFGSQQAQKRMSPFIGRRYVYSRAAARGCDQNNAPSIFSTRLCGSDVNGSAKNSMETAMNNEVM